MQRYISIGQAANLWTGYPHERGFYGSLCRFRIQKANETFSIRINKPFILIPAQISDRSDSIDQKSLGRLAYGSAYLCMFLVAFTYAAALVEVVR